MVELEHLALEFGPQRRRCVVKIRGRSYPSSYHNVRIRRGSLDVFPQLVAAEPGRLDYTLLSGYWADAGSLASLALANRLVGKSPPLLRRPTGSGKAAISVGEGD